jgi:hypothetical protein
VDNFDKATLNATRPREKYTDFLDLNGLMGARIGIFAPILNSTGKFNDSIEYVFIFHGI